VRARIVFTCNNVGFSRIFLLTNPGRKNAFIRSCLRTFRFYTDLDVYLYRQTVTEVV